MADYHWKWTKFSPSESGIAFFKAGLKEEKKPVEAQKKEEKKPV